MDHMIKDLRAQLRAQYPRVAFSFQPVAADLADVYPEEAAQLSPNAVPKRRAEHRAGRAAARSAMKMLGRPPVAILKGDKGQPLWPDGLVGAITHTDTLAIAALAERRNVAGLGIDLEQADRFHSHLAPAILTPAETTAGVDLGSTFTAKEAIYKAAFPLVKKLFGFSDVTVIFNEDRAGFQAVADTAFFAGFKVGEPFATGRVFRVGEVILALAELDKKYGG